MKSLYCKRDFHKAGVAALSIFSNEVQNGIYNNSGVFTAPPITVTQFGTAKSKFKSAAADYKQSGITFKTTYIVARTHLINVLDNMAVYVESVAQGDVSIIALSDFHPSMQEVKEVPPLDKIDSFTVMSNVVPGQVTVVVPAINNKGLINYSCICAKKSPLLSSNFINQQIVFDANCPQIHFDCGRGRQKVFHGLTAGVPYYVYVFAANSASVSPLSDFKIVWPQGV